MKKNLSNQQHFFFFLSGDKLLATEPSRKESFDGVTASLKFSSY